MVTRYDAKDKLANFQFSPKMRERFRNTVIAKSIDCMSVMIFENAFVEKVEDYYFVFPEHHEKQLFHVDEYYVAEYQRVYKENK
jgi:hypothetical protein